MELLNIFFPSFIYKSSGFNDLVYNSSVLVLMIWSFKDVLKGLTLDFALFTLDFTLDF